MAFVGVSSEDDIAVWIITVASSACLFHSTGGSFLPARNDRLRSRGRNSSLHSETELATPARVAVQKAGFGLPCQVSKKPVFKE